MRSLRAALAKEAPVNDEVIYHYRKTRRQQSKLFIRMGLFCWLYIAGLYIYESISGKGVPEDFRSIAIISLSIASIVLFLIAWWHLSHPATYEALITRERFTVDYPNHPPWSFNVRVADIERFENRRELTHAGEGEVQQGILLKDGRFFYVSMNYGNRIGEMYKAVRSVNPDVTYPTKVNVKAHGLGIKRDYSSGAS